MSAKLLNLAIEGALIGIGMWAVVACVGILIDINS